jgi:hypothetical protein
LSYEKIKRCVELIKLCIAACFQPLHPFKYLCVKQMQLIGGALGIVVRFIAANHGVMKTPMK